MAARTRRSTHLATAVARGLLAACWLGAAGVAQAQTDNASEERSRALATDLFDRGVKLMVAHKCDEGTTTPESERAACTEALGYFVKASREYPKAIGAHRNAAFVARGLGKVALAARSFREVARRAPLDQSESRRRWAEPAQKEADALAPRIPHLVLKIDGPPPEGLKLSLDGEAIDRSLVATPIALDPGEHVVRAEAPDRAPAEKKVTLAEKDAADVVLTLAPITKAAPVVVAESPVPPPPPKKRSQLAPILVTSGGAAVAVVGLVFGGLAKGTRDGACDVAAGTCRSQSDLDKARSQATVSTVLTIFGAAVAAGGAVWWAVSPKYEATPTAYGFSTVPLPGGALFTTTVIR